MLWPGSEALGDGYPLERWSSQAWENRVVRLGVGNRGDGLDPVQSD